MDLPPLQPPASPSSASGAGSAGAAGQGSGVGSSPPVPPVSPVNPSVPSPTVTSSSGAATPSVAPAPASFPSARTSEPIEPAFTPTSPILSGLQGMSSQPFQDPARASVEPTIPGINGAAPVSSSSVPNERLDATSAAAASAAVPQENLSSRPVSPSTEGASAGRPPSSPGKPTKPGGFSLPGGPKLLAVIGVIVVLLLGGFAAFSFLNRGGPSPSGGSQGGSKTTITYWGLWESPEVMEPLITQYEALNPGVDIVYQQQSSQQYRARTQTALQNGSGPDIFRYHNTWLPMIRSDLATAPRAVLPATELQQSFYPIMAQELVVSNQVVGVPLMYDGLALVYNQAMFEAANALPPRDWPALRELAARLAIKNDTRLERGGVAIGTADNVDNYSDILALMMLQNGATPGNPLSPNAQTALEFYTLFSRSDGVWNSTMPQSTVAFANEQVAMILAPSWRIHEIQRLNPNLRIGVARLPQLSEERITWGSYWVEGVNKNSRNTEEAWKFLAWLSQPEQLRRFYTEAVKYRGFGELYPRVDMASELAEDPYVQPYLEDALYAQSWPLASMTHDEGLNDQLIQYYTDAVNQMNRSGSAQSALEQVLPGIQQVLSRYGLPVSSAGSGGS